MAHKKANRKFVELPKAASKRENGRATNRLLDTLRSVALKTQTDQPHTFFSVREIAKRYAVPISMVAKVYGILESEGLLSRIRGSKTILHGLHYDRRLRVRAFVGLPASLSRFITVQDYRMFFIRTRRELRLNGFATAMVFYQPEELQSALLSDRLKTYEIDTVLWFRPPTSARDTILRLRDGGIRLVTIGEGDESEIKTCYEIRRQKAFADLLNNWKTKHSVRTIAVAHSPQEQSTANEDIFRKLCRKLEITSISVPLKSKSTAIFLNSLRRAKTDAIAFPSSSLASRLCFRRPSAVTKLLHSRRVAFLEGPVNMPFAELPDVEVDLVTLDWPAIAKVIVGDFITQRAFRKSDPVSFEAEAFLRVPFSRFAEKL